MFFIFSIFSCSPYSPNLLHVPPSGMPGWDNLWSPAAITIDIFQSSSSPQSSKGGNREQTLPTKSNPNPDLTDAGEAENRWDGDSNDDSSDDGVDVDPNPDLSDAGEAENRWDRDFHGDDGHHDDDSDEDDDDVECWNLWKSSACQRLYILQGGRGGTRQS